MTILFVLSFFLSAFLMLLQVSRRATKNYFKLEGDPTVFDPSSINQLRQLEALAGDLEDDESMDVLYGALDITNESSKSVLTGDIDDIEDAIDDDDYVAEGALFKRFKQRRADRKAARKAGFKPNLLKRQAIANILKKETKVPNAIQKINQIEAASRTPGALLASTDVAPLQVTGGKIKQSETDLLIPGKNFANAITLWEQYYPGLSRSLTQISAGSLLTYTFIEPAAGEVTQVQVIIVTLAGSDISKLRFAEIGLDVSGDGTDGVAITRTRERVESFTSDDVAKTAMVIIPFKRIKETLFAVPYASPTTAKPLVVKLAGVPTGVSATVRLSGMDDEDWKSYKAMVGLN